MHSFIVVVVCLLSLISVAATTEHLPLRTRHVSRRSSIHSPLRRRDLRRRCKSRPAPPPATSTPASSSSSAVAPPATSGSPAPVPTDKPNNPSGTIQFISTCGDIGATTDISDTAGPNGSEHWLNCGLQDGGWRPQPVTFDDLVYVKDLNFAINQPGSPFSACRDFVGLFEKYGQTYNIPSILLASIAMQESTCNPEAVGGAGEQGIMQITRDKCGGAPGGNCRDPEFNIRTGAEYFKSQLDAHNGNVLATAGSYNGWFQNMSEGDARRAAYEGCCPCQQNLDYLHQLFNGWMQNRNGYNLGTIRNMNC